LNRLKTTFFGRYFLVIRGFENKILSFCKIICVNLPLVLKRILSISFSLIYLLTTVGISLSIHQCQGKTSYSVLGFNINKTCQCSHIDVIHQSKCCNTKKITLEKNNTDNFSPKTSCQIFLSGFQMAMLNDPAVLLSPIHSGINFTASYVKDPPDMEVCPLFIFNRSILI